jgi:hypothetical protein
MNAVSENIGDIQPNLTRRAGGGWLAVAPKGAFLRVGVTATTEEEAREKFRSTVHRWLEILEMARPQLSAKKAKGAA